MEQKRSLTNRLIKKTLNIINDDINLNQINISKPDKHYLTLHTTSLTRTNTGNPRCSLPKLKSLRKTLKSYLITNKIRDNIKNMKQSKNFLLNKFYTDSIKIKTKKTKTKIFLHTRNRTRNSLHDNQLNSVFSNTDYTSFSFTVAKNLNKKYKTNYSYNKNNIKFLKKNITFENLRCPEYTKKGKIQEFVESIFTIFKSNYKNNYLKFLEYQTKRDSEIELEKIKVELYHKQITQLLFKIYSNEFKNLGKKLQKIISLEKNYDDNLRWQIINLKIEINKVIVKIQKLLALKNKFVEIKNLLIEIKIYSSKHYYTSYEQLINIKNNLINKTNIHEQLLNKLIFLLNRKDLNIDILHELFKCLEEYDKKQKSTNENIFTSAEDFIETINSLYKNIINLLIEHNKTEKKIRDIKTKFNEILKSFQNNMIEDKEKSILYKLKSNILILLKEKYERLKNKKIHMYEKVNFAKKMENKALKLKIFNILNNLYRSNLTNKAELFGLKKQLSENDKNDILANLRLIEIKYNILISSKKEMLLKYPDAGKKVEAQCKEKQILQNKIKGKLKIKEYINKTFEKINKNRCYIPNKNNFYVNSFHGIKKRKIKVINSNIKEGDDSQEIYRYIVSKNDVEKEEK